MNLDDKLNKTIQKIDNLLEEDVQVFCINIIDGSILMRDNDFPMIILKKGELNITNIKNKLEYLMGTSVKNIKSLQVSSTDRYYAFDFEDKNILSTYKYIPITELESIELLKEIKDCLD